VNNNHKTAPEGAERSLTIRVKYKNGEYVYGGDVILFDKRESTHREVAKVLIFKTVREKGSTALDGICGNPSGLEIEFVRPFSAEIYAHECSSKRVGVVGIEYYGSHFAAKVQLIIEKVGTRKLYKENKEFNFWCCKLRCVKLATPRGEGI